MHPFKLSSQVTVKKGTDKVTLEQNPKAPQKLVLGSGSKCGLRLKAGPNVDEEHAVVESKGGRVYLTAKPTPAGADPMSMSLIPKPSFCWLNGAELRPGIAYLVAPGSTARFGSADNAGEEVAFEFAEQGGNNPLLMAVMKSMATNDDVKKRLD